jgi:hypothetical protein
MAKRKRPTAAAAVAIKETPLPLPESEVEMPALRQMDVDGATDESKPTKKTRVAPKKNGEISNSSTTKAEVIPKIKEGIEGLGDPEAEGEELADEEEVKEALTRPPPVNSDYLPLPWKGRLGYVRYTIAISITHELTSYVGVPQYVPPLLHSLRIQFSNLSYSIYH